MYGSYDGSRHNFANIYLLNYERKCAEKVLDDGEMCKYKCETLKNRLYAA